MSHSLHPSLRPSLGPNSREVKLEYKMLKEKMREYNKKDAQFYGKMFSEMLDSNVHIFLPC